MERSSTDVPGGSSTFDQSSTASVSAHDFRVLTNLVARAAAREGKRPEFRGVQLTATTDRVTAAATDSYRLAVGALEWDEGVLGQVLVPVEGLLAVAETAAIAGGQVRLMFGNDRLTIHVGERVLMLEAFDGESFPVVSKILPTEFGTFAIVECAPLLRALRRIAAVANGRSRYPVKLVFRDGLLELWFRASDGAWNEAVPADLEGPPVTVWFNPNYLLDGLDAIISDRVRFELQGSRAPAVVRPESTTNPDDRATDFLYRCR